METSLALDHQKAGDGRAHVVRALLTIVGKAPTDAGRVPLNLSIVVDRSGSMTGAPLAYVRDAAALLVRRLWPEDVVSVVAYDSEVETIAEPATGPAQKDLEARIRSIQPRGCTNLSGGWLRGRELVARDRREGAVNRILLLTDGLVNAGITDPDQLVELCRTASGTGISTTTIGAGVEYDEELLRRMAEAGGGNVHYIENPDQAPAIFQEEIDGLLSLTAQNVVVRLALGGAARLVKIHHRYPSHHAGNEVRLELGDLYARAPRMLLVEFLVPVEDRDEEVEIAKLTVTGDVLEAAGGMEHREVHLPIRASFASGPRTDPEVRRELLLQDAAQARDEAREARSEGEYEIASQRLDDVSDLLAAYGPGDDQLKEEAEDLRLMAERFRRGEVTEADAKYLYHRSYSAATSRRGTADAISRAGRTRGQRP